MPAKTKSQFRLMKAAENNPEFARKVGIKPSVAAEYTSSNKGKKAYSRLPERMKEGGVSLAVGRGEKMPVERGAGLTAKGRAKYNKVTGSNVVGLRQLAIRTPQAAHVAQFHRSPHESRPQSARKGQRPPLPG